MCVCARAYICRSEENGKMQRRMTLEKKIHSFFFSTANQIRGERQDAEDDDSREKLPGEGRVGALGDLLAGLGFRV